MVWNTLVLIPDLKFKKTNMTVVMKKKLTKSEKAEIALKELKQINDVTWEKFAENYLKALVDLISRAEKQYFNIVYFEGVFRINDFDDDTTLKFPILLKKEEQDWDVKYNFEDFTYRVESAENKAEVSERKEELKQKVLDKLTPEEKSALGF